MDNIVIVPHSQAQQLSDFYCLPLADYIAKYTKGQEVIPPPTWRL